ncbi:hypothetical protein F5Y00DRAFT_119374 [Daldinia vernicosa]|uniref:uncharacterized protein n=1 Tax=Daldinia vernicosa TaxID=114800 RepID=UPI0020082F4C|nr:uncharacterized protein F5Y00DRAFT_119374 [Daldinia vernicosa]KAI0847472.1 hypothetical protein F5Y00DRAFT_119374 [Daldinia vernicosa]
MNWTEGNLSRHSRGRQRNELLTRQKQHFAKVRNNLLKSDVKRSPVSISFLGTQYSRDLKRRDDSSSAAYKQPSSPLLTEKRNRARSSLDNPDNQSSTREKRRRLLDKADWVGLNLQQPIDITFPGQLQASAGSRWSKVGRPRVRMLRKYREDSRTPRLGAAHNSHGPSLKIQIGSQETLPNTSISSQSNSDIKRYSLVPQPITGLPRRKSNLTSSPEPSQTRRPYVVSRDSQLPQVPKGERHGIAGGHQGGAYRNAVKKSLFPEEPTHVVYSSSIIHEPTPLRANYFTVLRWTPSGSDDQGSMQVEIDRPLRPIPSSQEADEEIWKNWVSTSSMIQPVSASANSPIAISSVSSRAGGLPSHLQRRLPSYDISSEAGLSTNYPPQEPNIDDQAPQAKIHESHHQSPEEKPGHSKIKTQPPDDDAVWMKFALSDNSDELEARVFAEAAFQAAAELRPSDTSTSFNDAAETIATHGSNPASNEDQDESTSFGYSDESHVATDGTVASESVLSNIATVGSTIQMESEPRFRFAQPRAFVGKFADSNVATTGGSRLVSHSKKRRGRPRKRAVDGRANIRRLPDFDGDPIEEFEDD